LICMLVWAGSLEGRSEAAGPVIGSAPILDPTRNAVQVRAGQRGAKR